MTFGEKIQRLRKLNNLSQEQLAEKLNVSRQAISKWEIGAMPDMENVIKISNFFDCSLDYLLNNEMTEESSNKKESIPAEIQKRIRPETLCVVISILSAISIAALWIVSRFIDVGIHRQDATTGYWYTGFSSFIDYFELYGLLYGLVFILLLSIIVRVYIQLFLHNKAGNKRFLVCRLVSLLLYMLGIICWVYCAMRPWTFLWSPITYITILVYCMLRKNFIIIISNTQCQFSHNIALLIYTFQYIYFFPNSSFSLNPDSISSGLPQRYSTYA